ncbi:MAG TPA: thioesterase family protein [Burkholderiaceae bacterium]|nr:thioesterase family protein [Burkholderiaceae bacterium]HSC00159.1 thioesterase family protein [Burkholderiaceae bacterium]
MSERPQPEPRGAYPFFTRITTRWMDNDVYGHINNVVYYSFFDTAVNSYLIEREALDIHRGEVIGLVVETHCNFFAPLQYPQAVEAGVRVGRVGTSSVRYEIGLFADAAAACAAAGHFVHVYVDRASRRPVALPQAMLSALAPLRIDAS